MIWLLAPSLIAAVVLSFALGVRWARRRARLEELWLRDVEARVADSDVNHYKTTAPRAVISRARFSRSHLWGSDNYGDS